MRRPVRLLPLLLVPALLTADQPPTSEEVQRQLERGRQLYVESTSPSGAEFVAILGEGLEIEASAVPCSGCHGRDGRGRPEGGVTPTDITWDRLTRPYGATAPTGRRHPPYTESLMKRALSLGIDPGGVPFQVAMPRYRMSHQDMNDLLAYLKTLGLRTAPGVGDDMVKIGVLLPPKGALGDLGQAVRATLEARLGAANQQGGIFGRRLELRFFETPGPPGQRREWAADFLEREQIFAVVAPFFAGAEAELAGLFEDQQIPAIGPFTVHPQEGVAVNRYVFYLLPGVEIQSKALVRLARETAGSPVRPVLLAPEGAGLDAAVAAVEKAATGWAEVAVRRYPREGFAAADLARELAAEKADPVFFLGSGTEAASLLSAALPLGWQPRLYATGAAADAGLFAAPGELQGRIFVALPSSPEIGSGAAARYRELAAAASLPTDNLSAQVTALGAAEVLVTALTRAGRDLDREKLVETLETFLRVDTGYLPPISYGPSRRLGARGAFLARVDLRGGRFEPAGGWVEVE